MEEKQPKHTDCEVCERLIREKHKYDFVWKVLCVIFMVISIVLAILYFGSGAMITETTIEIGNDNAIGNKVDGDGSINGDNNLVIGVSDDVTTGTIKNVDYTPIIIISILGSVAILLIGGIIIANHNKKSN